MTEFLGNSNLESEYLTGCIIQGNKIPDDYTTLRFLLSSLPIPTFGVGETSLTLLKKKIIDKIGLLKDKEVESFYYGKNPELLALLEAVKVESIALQPLLKTAIIQEQQLYYNEVFKRIDEKADVYDMAQIANNMNPLSPHNPELIDSEKTLEILQSRLETIVPMYGAAISKIKDKTKSIQSILDLKIYINALQTYMIHSSIDPIVIINLNKALETIVTYIPTDELDPYKVDLVMNIFKIFSNPKEFYSYCQQDEILDKKEGNSFFEVFPEFHLLFVNMYLDKFEEMDYQDQLNFRKCFDLIEDNGDLVSLCKSSFVNKPVDSAV